MTAFWWEYHGNLARLWRWLEERDEAPDVDDYLSAPWHWSPEWNAMLKEAA